MQSADWIAVTVAVVVLLLAVTDLYRQTKIYGRDL